ncbi:MAG: 2-oxo acid dehydrogenase subunit E2 [Deltaproteobacteria bacterium]|nr:2-oxo acid dehydrogenase subunit E2 [Deltaproteobacteria bacterium]
MKEIKMPQLSDTMSEAKIISWKKKVGEKCNRGDVIAEVETDKANLEIECFFEGVLSEIRYGEGSTVKVGEVIAVINGLSAGKADVDQNGQKSSEADSNTASPVSSLQSNSGSASLNDFSILQATRDKDQSRYEERRLKASPLAKKLAKDKGLSLLEIHGSGPEGRIIAKDVESLVQYQSNLSSSSSGTVKPSTTSSVRTEADISPFFTGVSEKFAISKMRQAIGSAMVKSFSEIPHFYLKGKIISDRLIEFRNNLKTSGGLTSLTYTHLIVKALGCAIKQVSAFNTKLDGDFVVHFDDVDIGIVVAVDDGLLVPVIRKVDKLPLVEFVLAFDHLVSKARQKKLSASDLSGGCFAVSNLGMYEIEDFSAIIYPGHTGILAVSSIVKEPVVDGDQIAIRNVMRITLSLDHRVVDGVSGAKLLGALKTYLEKPELILL